MKASRSIKLEQQLAAAEEAFRCQLLSVLPRVESSGESLFFNSRHMPSHFQAHWLPRESEPLFELASECLDLREQLSLPTPGSLAAEFVSACAEAASNDPHRRGPRKLASTLLAYASRVSA